MLHRIRLAMQSDTFQKVDDEVEADELAERRLARVRHMWEVGIVQQIELLLAELAVSELEADLQQMQRNLELLDRPAQ